MISRFSREYKTDSIVPFLCALSICFFVLFQPISVKANPLYASAVMDAETGEMLRQRYANKKLHPASLTKVMTLLMVFEALQKGDLRLSDRIYVSPHAASMVPSKLGLEAGSYIRVRDAIYALSVKSANDVAVAVAEHLGGTERNFARLMTFRAKQIGMKRTKFMNASGLHHKRQVSTARDMAVMARYVIKNYPREYKYFRKASFTYRGKTYRNHNKLLRTYPGVDGMKTGYIGAAGFNLIASAVRNDRRIIAVVFGGKTSQRRNKHMVTLLDAGFRQLPAVRTAQYNIPTPDKKPSSHEISVALANLAPAAGLSTRAMIPPPHSKVSMIEQGSASDDFKAPKAWSIQVGAFKTEGQTHKALRKAVKALPVYYKNAKAKIVPMTVSGNSLYRARLTGYTAHDAYAACAYIQDCITIAP